MGGEREPGFLWHVKQQMQTRLGKPLKTVCERNTSQQTNKLPPTHPGCTGFGSRWAGRRSQRSRCEQQSGGTGAKVSRAVGAGYTSCPPRLQQSSGLVCRNMTRSPPEPALLQDGQHLGLVVLVGDAGGRGRAGWQGAARVSCWVAQA